MAMPPPASGVATLLDQARRLLQARRPGEAVPALRAASLLQPDNATIAHDLGLACLESGQPVEAAAALRRATQLRPRYTDAYFRLGLALEALGALGEAVAAYDRATELLPSLTEAWFRAGALVYTLGHPAEAAGCFRRAAATGPRTSFGRLGAARALLAEDRHAEAERALRRMLALEPDHPMALDLLGNLLAEAGRFDEARTCFARAVQAAPLMAGAYYDLVRCRRVTPEDALMGPLEAALDVPGLVPEQRLRVLLALGKAADDLGDHGQAMHAYDAADAVRTAGRPFNSAAFTAEITHLIDRFSPELIAQAPSLGCRDARPVLIIGMPRSGTTLVEQIVSSHPEVSGGGELDFWNQRVAAWHAAGPAGTQAPFLAAAAADYLGVLQAIGPGAQRITDKMPFNFLWAGLIHLALPDAIFIHCRRAAIDTALSIHQTLFSPRLAFPTGGRELVAYFGNYARLTDHWRRVLPADRFIEIDHETLTRTPEPEIRRLIGACGLDWDAACLHPERNARVVKTPSKWQARQPIYRDEVERWRRYEPWLGDLRTLLPTNLTAD